jgi:FPC/CPF motif-containing protein YcgG
MNEYSSGTFHEHALTAFRDWIVAGDFPCVGAKAALNSDAFSFHTYDELASRGATAHLARDLQRFTRDQTHAPNEYATFIAVFARPTDEGEEEFEALLWHQLSLLNAIDTQPWDPAVRSDADDPQFSFSFAGQALYVIGMHANTSRDARRFPWPALVFNPHEQFERLRADGKWRRMQQTIRERDLRLQGSINPMLSDFGERSEARQYSGRAVEENWQPPAGKCPFAH